MKLSENFTMREFTKSTTAERKQIIQIQILDIKHEER